MAPALVHRRRASNGEEKGTGDEHTEVLVEGATELVEHRRHPEALPEHAAQVLDMHDLGPLNKSVQVLLGR
jgi:hypothetical protein